MKVRTNMRTNSFVKNRLLKTGHFVAIIVFYIAIIQQTKAQEYETDFTFIQNNVSGAVRQAMQHNAKAVFSTINKSFVMKQTGLNLSTTNATAEAVTQIQSLWSTSRFYCTDTDIIARVLHSAKGWQVRSIPVLFENADTEEDKYQEIVIEFTLDGKISDIFPAMPMNQYYSMIQTQDTVIELRRRLTIAKFVEDFRVAHYKRDIKYLNSVYSDDALIITGKVLKKAGDGMQPIVEYRQTPKSKYIENLKRVFARNSYLNLKFDELMVIKHEKNSNIFGVTLRQKWMSSTYNDEGWLFLMIDFKNEDEPLIWVRTWQPLEVSKNQVFSLIDFPMR